MGAAAAGIIDILQQYTTKKFLENKFKALAHGGDASGISALAPRDYGKRFIKFMEEQTQ